MSSFDFTQVMTRVANHQTLPQKALHIRRLIKELERNRTIIHEEFKKEIMEVFGQKNEDGTLKTPEGAPGEYIPIEEKTEEMVKAQESFGKKLATLNWRPLTPDTLGDLKLSAKEIEILGPLLTEENGPGLAANFAPPGAGVPPHQRHL